MQTLPTLCVCEKLKSERGGGSKTGCKRLTDEEHGKVEQIDVTSRQSLMFYSMLAVFFSAIQTSLMFAPLDRNIVQQHSMTLHFIARIQKQLL